MAPVATTPPKLSPPSTGMAKSSPANGTSKITCFFSKSPSKNKRTVFDLEAENQENCSSAKKSKRAIHSLQTPLRAHATSDEVICVEAVETVWGLKKIDSSTEVPKTLTVKAGDAKPLSIGSVLGRNVGAASVIPASKRNDKVDLNITAENGGEGISRKHIKVKSMNSNTIKIEQFVKVNETVYVTKYNAVTKSMALFPIKLMRGQTLELTAGDAIVFDALVVIDGQPAKNPKPRHVFRVVRLSSLKNSKKLAAKSSAPPTNVVDLCASSNSQQDVPLVAALEVRTTRKSTPSVAPPRVVLDNHEAGPIGDTPLLATHGESMGDIIETPQNEKAHDSLTSVDKEAVQASSPPAAVDECASQTVTPSTTSVPASMSPQPISETPSTQFPIPKPKAGDLFRVELETKDILGKVTLQWFFGEAVKIVQGKGSDPVLYKVKLKFEDNQCETYDYPHGDTSIQRIELDSKGTRALSLVFDPSTGETSQGEVAYDEQPETLGIGDLVDAQYQNAMGPTEDGTWFRGRIAEVVASKNTAAVAYFDGDVEYNVPIGEGKIRLIARGFEDTAWLELLRVDTSRGKGAKKKPKGIITRFERPTGACRATDLKVKVSFAGDKHKTFSYAVVAKWLIADYLESVKAERVILWPVEKALDKAATEIGSVKGANALNRQAKVANDFDENDFCQPERKPYKVERVTDPADMLSMHPSLANAFFRALDSSEPHIGERFLSQMATLHNRGPTPKTGQNLLKLLMNGPQSEGTLFPDPNRLDHARNYADLLMSAPTMTSSLIDCFPLSTWGALSGCLLQLKDRAYQVEGDEVSINKAALERVQHSLQLAAVSADLFACLFKFELDDFVSADKMVSQKSYRDKKLVKALLGNPNGIRDSLKMVTKIYATAWIKCGHFIVPDPITTKTSTRSKQYAAYDAVPTYVTENCSTHAIELMESLGKILSYVAWLYCAEQKVGMDNSNLATEIKNILISEVDNTTFDPSPFLEAKGSAIKNRPKYYKQLKLEFVVNLDFTLTEKLQANLAKRLNISDAYALFAS